MKSFIRQLSPGVLLLYSSLSFAQNNLDKLGLTASAPSSVAYSLRLLSTNYSGNAIQIRRSSDNTTQNIGFTVNGDLDTTTLKSFVGSSDGFVSIWYDQSGNGNNLFQSTAVYQPKLVNAGVVYRENTRPFIRFFGFIGSSNFQALVLATQMTTVGFVNAVHRLEPTGDGFILGHTGVYYWHSNPVAGLISNTYASTSVKGGSGWTNGTPYSPTSMPWPASLSINEIAPSSPNSLVNWDNIGTDRITAHNTTGGGGYSELIIFPAALSASNRHTLEVSQASYYAINAALPLDGLSFTARINKTTVRLEWNSNNEQSLKNFTIQRSVDGRQWTSIAVIDATGDINSGYSYADANPAKGNNYYRILTLYADGKSGYSNIVSVNFDGNISAFSVMANPVLNGLLQLQVTSTTILTLYSADGKLIWKRQLNFGQQTIPVSNYAKGVYLLKSNEKTEKILIQ